MISTPTKMNSDYQFLMLTIHSIILSLFLIFRLRQRRCFYVILASFLHTHSFCLVVPWWSNIRYFDSHRTLDILERRHPRFISTGGTWILIFWFFWKDFVHVTFPVVVCCMLALFVYCPYSMRKNGNGHHIRKRVYFRYFRLTQVYMVMWNCGSDGNFFFPFWSCPRKLVCMVI